MIIGIVDYPGRKHEWLLNLLEKEEAFVLKGNLEYLETETNNLQKNNKNPLIFWDYPTLLEDGCVNKVDKVLKIGYFNKSLNDKEKRLYEIRDSIADIVYRIAWSCPIRDKSQEKKNAREEFAKKVLSAYILMWKLQGEGSDKIFQDEFLLNLAKDMAKDSGVNIRVEGSTNHPYVARYLHESNTIFLNALALFNCNIKLYDLIIIIAHELGHSHDPNLPELENKKRKLNQKLLNATSVSEIEKYIPIYLEVTLKLENNAYDFSYLFLTSRTKKIDVENDRKRNEEGYIKMIEEFKVSCLEKFHKHDITKFEQNS